MAGVSIGQMTIDAPGLTEAEGRKLARLVADRLGAAAARIDRPVRQASAKASVQGGGPGGGPGGMDALAEQIVADLLRRIGTTV